MPRMLDASDKAVSHGWGTSLNPGDSRTILDARGSYEGGELATVALFAKLPKSPIVGFRFKASAIIQFGSGGIMSEVELDYAHGTMLTIAGTAVRVNAFYESDGAPAAPVPIEFGACIVYGTRPSGPGSMPRKTMGKETIAALNSGLVVPIPAFASVVGATSSLGATSCKVNLYAGDGATLVGSLTLTAGGETLPIPADASFAQVANVNAIAGGDFNLYFGIST